MRLSLEFTLEKGQIGIEYRKTMMHFLKTCLNGANDGKYFDTYYDGSKTKNFGFAVFFDQPIFKGSFIELELKRVRMIFSTADKMTGYIFYSSFLEKKHKKLVLEAGNTMILERVTKLEEKMVQNNKMLIKMNCPLLVRKHVKESNTDWYYCIEDEKFTEELNYNVRMQLQEQGFPNEYVDEFKIEPVKCKKVVVQHYGCKFAGTLGNFLVEGNKSVLNYLLQASISSRRSEGFGLAELLTDDV